MPNINEQLDKAFSPKVVAVIGARRADDYIWLRNMSDFKGKLYSVQVADSDIEGIEELGIENYKSIGEIPEAVDYAVFAVPRRFAASVLRDAVEKNIPTVHMFTSGYAESGEEQAIKDQDEIRDIATQGGTLIIGPNCMGVFNPEVGMRFGAGQDINNIGNVSVISQSGAHASSMTAAMQGNGIGINRTISFGNGIVLDSPDLLSYFSNDPKTKLICGYIEGPKNGKRFFEELRKVTPHKPVVLWKGGQTDAGVRSVASHTGSLAGSVEVWNAMVNQAGAIRADSLEEALDATKALLYLTPTTGQNIGIIGGSGGQSVSMSDDFSRAGLNVPRLTESTLTSMGEFFQLVGASYFNPLDVGGMNRGNIENIINLLGNDPNIDILALMVGAQSIRRRSIDDTLEQLELYAKTRDATGKPLLGIFWTPTPYKDSAVILELDEAMQNLGIPTFPNPERAAKAVSKVVQYYRFRQSLV
jgi:acyl-CoA synthetase (NDP forming)